MIASVLYHFAWTLVALVGLLILASNDTHTQLELNFAFAMNVELVYQKSDIAE